VFDFQEEAFDEVSFAVEDIIAFDLRRGCSGRDDGNSALLDNGLSESL
jgi:hypothetical protein